MKNVLVIRNISRSGLIQLTCVSLEKKFQVPIKNKNTCRKKIIYMYISGIKTQYAESTCFCYTAW